MRKIIVAPSLLAADASKFGAEIISARDSGAEWIHFDIMDGHFVPNLSYGPHMVKCLSSYGLVNDVHLMIEEPIKYARKFIEAGADYITIHAETVDDIIQAQQEIRSIKSNIKVGLSIKPRTPVEDILDFVNFFDMILIMSVEPGFGGQEFLASSLPKVKKLREFIDENNLSTLIEVDGGVDDNSSVLLREAGADVLVCGSYFFHSEDREEAISKLKGLK